jgi:hypothetical protein
MYIEVKSWHDTTLGVGDLTYYKGTLLKVTRRTESKDGKKLTVKFRKIGRLKLKVIRFLPKAV